VKKVSRNWRALLSVSGVVVLSVAALPMLSSSAAIGSSLSGPVTYTGADAVVNPPVPSSISNGNIGQCTDLQYFLSNPIYPLANETSWPLSPDAQSHSTAGITGTVTGASLTLQVSSAVVVDYVVVKGGAVTPGNPGFNLYTGPATNFTQSGLVAPNGFSHWFVCYHANEEVTTTTQGETTTTQGQTTTTQGETTTTQGETTTTQGETTTTQGETTTTQGETTTTQGETTTTQGETTTTQGETTTTQGETTTTQGQTTTTQGQTTTTAPTTVTTAVTTSSTQPGSTTTAPAPTTTVVTNTIPANPGTSPTTVPPTYHIPSKAPQTGAGGAASTDAGAVLGISGLLLLAGLALMGVLVRRRRA
jgi:hypothetical protein